MQAMSQGPYGHSSCPVRSVAIMIYLSFKYQTAEHWYPPDLQARARIHEYLGWHADCIRGVFGVPLWTKVRRTIQRVADIRDLVGGRAVD